MFGRALFDDRRDAGRQLAERLQKYHGAHTVVVGLPRGGVEVAYEVALALDAPLDVIVARKIGAPSQPELGIGAIAPGGVGVPVCALPTASQIAGEVDELVCIERPDRFMAVGVWYRKFDQTTDAQVIELLEEARDEVAPEDLTEQ